MTSTQLESTIVQLDALHTAYAELLEQAKLQLEAVDLTPAIISGLQERLKDDTAFCREAGRTAADMIKQDIRQEESVVLDTYAGRNLCEAVADRMFEAIKRRIDSYISERVTALLESGNIERKLEQKVMENSAINEGLIIRRRLTEILNVLPEDKDN